MKMADVHTLQLSQETLAVFKDVLSSSSGWMNGLFALGGVLLGGVVQFVISRCENSRLIKQNRVGVAHQIYAEISAILEIIDKRQYIVDLTARTKLMQAGVIYQPYIISITSDVSPIYKANLSKLSLLDAQLQTQIVIFYKFLDALIEDVKVGGTFSSGLTLDACLEFLSLADDMVNTGENIKKTLKSTFKIS